MSHCTEEILNELWKDKYGCFLVKQLYMMLTSTQDDTSLKLMRSNHYLYLVCNNVYESYFFQVNNGIGLVLRESDMIQKCVESYTTIDLHPYICWGDKDIKDCIMPISSIQASSFLRLRDGEECKAIDFSEC